MQFAGRLLLTSDIEEINSLNRPVFNQFASRETRMLPTPTTLTFRSKNYYPGKEELIFYINKIEIGEKLSEYENIRYIALLMIYKNEVVTRRFLEGHNAIDYETDDVKDEIKYHKNRIDFYLSETNSVSEEFKEQIDIQVEKNKAFVESELLNAGFSKKKMYGEYVWLFRFLLETAMLFTPKTIMFHPTVVLDLRGLFHIFLRHVDIINNATNLKDRTHFQYILDFGHLG